jgi:predicted O-methyltransferase YrrM
MKRILKKILSPLLTIFRKYKTNQKIRHLTTHQHPKVKAIGVALSETIHNIKSIEELNYLRLIEDRRTFLLNSKREISVKDHGASRESPRTMEEMKKGFHSVKLVSEVTKGSKPEFWAFCLYKLIRNLEPNSCVELGTCVGISASYIGTGLQLNGKGKLSTLEGAPEIAKIAEETLQLLKINNSSVILGPFHETLDGVLEKSSPIDFFFNDGHHDHDAVIHYFNQSITHFSEEAVIVFDDISWSQGMRKAWSEIENDARVKVSIDLKKIGIVLISNKSMAKEKIIIQI